jgi:D-serine deaminase-like pyridoxal phosphate-dependent protein
MADRALPPTPLLALDLPAFERNVARMAHTIVTQGGKRWRPHTKAIRSPALMQRLLAAGATGVTCATVGEAQVMVQAGIEDVLIASPVVAPAALEQLARLNRTASVIAAIDAPEHLALLAAAADQAGVVLPFVIEVDVGLERAGVRPGAAAAALAQAARAYAQLRFCGLMAWEGHVTRLADPQAKQSAIEASVGLLLESARCCREAGIAVDIVSCGGTGTYFSTSAIAGVTELQAGGGVFGDLRYRNEFKVALEPALTLRSTVLSRPGAGRIVCDAGWKYHGLHPTPSQPLGLPKALRLAWSAEHLTLDCEPDGALPRVGEQIELSIGYADSTVFLHHELIAMRHGAIEDVLPLPARP